MSVKVPQRTLELLTPFIFVVVASRSDDVFREELRLIKSLEEHTGNAAAMLDNAHQPGNTDLRTPVDAVERLPGLLHETFPGRELPSNKVPATIRIRVLVEFLEAEDGKNVAAPWREPHDPDRRLAEAASWALLVLETFYFELRRINDRRP